MKTLKKLFIGIFALTSFNDALAQQLIYDLNTKITQMQFIDPMEWESRFDNFPSSSVATISTNGYQVILANYEELKTSGGVFRNISIKYNEKEILNLKQSDGWAKVGQSFSSIKSNDYFLSIPLTIDNILLIFFGHPYVGDPEQLTMVILNNGSAKMIFNKHYHVNSLQKSPFRMEIQSNVQEYIAPNTPAQQAILHEIYLENGKLFFRNK